MLRKQTYTRMVGVWFKQETYNQLNELSHKRQMNQIIKYGEKLKERPGVSILVREIVENYLSDLTSKK